MGVTFAAKRDQEKKAWGCRYCQGEREGWKWERREDFKLFAINGLRSHLLTK